MTQLSIIVPAYNVEKYIRSCFESIYQQGLNENVFEIIIVNDGTTDRSMEMIDDIINQHQNITVINQHNQGLSVARNNGIAQANGDYILMPDPDDLLIKNSLKPLLEKAIESQADLVVADFLSMTDKEIESIQEISQEELIIKEKTGEQLYLEDLSPYHCFVWRTLYRRQFLLDSKITFYPDIRFQDIPFTHECYLKAKKCLRVSWLLNIYRQWPEASTASFNEGKAKDFCIAIAKTWGLLNLKLPSIIKHKLQENVWIHFSVMICLTCHFLNKDIERINVINVLKKEAPTLEFPNGIKQRIVSFLYKYLPHTFIRIRFLYGIVFENKLLPFYHHKLKKILV